MEISKSTTLTVIAALGRAATIKSSRPTERGHGSGASHSRSCNMPDPLRLGAAVRADIAAQISARLYRPRTTFALDAADRLGDSLRVMLLTVEAVRRPTGTLEDRLIDTGQWHHQLLRANLAMAFARSVAVDPAVPQERQQVVELA